MRAESSVEEESPSVQQASSPSCRAVFWLLVCFTCSGMSGLVYEVAWVRSLELIFGATTFAVATVLASFMGGLACGSYSMGKLAARFAKFHPLRLYAAIECLIGLVAIVIPLTFRAMIPVYQYVWKYTHASFVTFSVIRFALSVLILLIPTFLMGTTLPIVSSFVAREPTLGKRRIGLLYTFNTLGAVLGCVAAGLILFPRIGLAKTQWVAVVLNMVAGGGAFWLSSRKRPEVHSSQNNRPEPSVSIGSSVVCETTLRSLSEGDARLLVGVYALSGFVAMLYEVAWSRALVMALGSSTYAYTIMLATFLFGLALGAWLATCLMVQSFSTLAAAGLCQFAIALSTFLSVFLMEEMPFFYLKTYEAIHPGAAGLLNLQFLLAAGLMILPTIGLGAMFPITIQGLNSSGERAAPVVGWAYALNTLGAIAGSVVAGFWLVPLLGSQKTLLMGIAVNSLLALGVLLAALPVRLSRYRPVLPVVVLLFCVNLFYSVPSWDPAVMSSSVFRYIRDYAGLTREAFRERAQRIAGEILMFKEGLTCTITIFRNPEVTSLMVNGKPDASTPSGLNPITENSPIDALHDLPTQSLFGHVPLLLAPKIDDVLVIGLGSGVTLGSVMTHPVKHVECIELEDAVVRGDQFFEEFNLRPLSDPRTHLVVNDARNHLLVTDRKYDVIISEPSNPWIPGAASLFTREFFEVSKSKLQPNGVFCQWIQLYELQESHFQTILHTFASVFPEIHVFRVKHDAILLASMRPIKIREMEIRERFTPRVRTDLARIRIKSTEDLLARYWIGGDELRKAVQNEPFNTDDNMLIEFAAPLQVLTAHSRGTRRILAQMFDDRTTAALGQIELDPSTDPALFWARVGQAALRVKSYHEARLYGEASWKLEQNAEAAAVLATGLQARRENERAFALLQEAEKRFPKSPEVLRALALFHSRNSQWKEARPYAERLLVEAPNDPVGLLCLGRSQYYMDEARASVRTFEKILPSDRARPELEDLPFYLGTLYWGEKRYTEVAEQFKIYLKTDPSNIELRAQLADALYHIGKVPEAVLQWQQIGSLNLARANQLVKEAAVASRSGQEQEALRRLDEAVLLDSGNAELVLLLARQKQSQNDTGGAVELLQTYLQWHPDKPIAVGYLSQLLAAQKKQKEALVLAARYRALTGRPWEEIP